MARVKAEVPREAGVGGGGGLSSLNSGPCLPGGKSFPPQACFVRAQASA